MAAEIPPTLDNPLLEVLYSDYQEAANYLLSGSEKGCMQVEDDVEGNVETRLYYCS